MTLHNQLSCLSRIMLVGLLTGAVGQAADSLTVRTGENNGSWSVKFTKGNFDQWFGSVTFLNAKGRKITVKANSTEAETAYPIPKAGLELFFTETGEGADLNCNFGFAIFDKSKKGRNFAVVKTIAVGPAGPDVLLANGPKKFAGNPVETQVGDEVIKKGTLDSKAGSVPITFP